MEQFIKVSKTALEIVNDIESAGYLITEHGVISKVNGEYLKPYLNKKRGYYTLILYQNTIPNYYTLHRVLAFKFIENPENKPHINHKNGIKTDNRLQNLEWCTRSENVQHAINTGLKKVSDIQCRKVIDTANGVIYPSIRVAAEGYGCNYGVLKSWLNGYSKNKTTLNYYPNNLKK